jgi:hypothetical protein
MAHTLVMMVKLCDRDAFFCEYCSHRAPLRPLRDGGQWTQEPLRLVSGEVHARVRLSAVQSIAPYEYSGTRRSPAALASIRLRHIKMEAPVALRPSKYPARCVSPLCRPVSLSVCFIYARLSPRCVAHRTQHPNTAQGGPIAGGNTVCHHPPTSIER